MLIDTKPARHEWAARVTLQAEQMRVLAAATNDDEMRAEFLDQAHRLSTHADWITLAKA